LICINERLSLPCHEGHGRRHDGRKQQEKLMTFGESLYLGLVIIAFVAFALTLAYQSHADRRSAAGK
jgi:hypothetical protein